MYHCRNPTSNSRIQYPTIKKSSRSFQFQQTLSLPPLRSLQDSLFASTDSRPLDCQRKIGRPLIEEQISRSLRFIRGQATTSRQVFDEIPDPDNVSCKVMIRWHFMNNLYEEIIGFYKFTQRRFFVVDNIVLLVVLKACSELRDFGEGRKLHCHIVQTGKPDSFVLTRLVDMYTMCGEFDTARRVF